MGSPSSQRRKVQMLPLDSMFFQRTKLDRRDVVGNGVHVNNLIKIIEAMINKTYLPPDARIEWLYFDHRLDCWAILITSETYRDIPEGEMAPLLEF